MDLFLAGCQGLGLGLAAGALGGSLGVRDVPGTALALAAGVAGAVLYGASLTPEDHPAWPGWVAGGLVALLSYVVIRDIALGARARAGEGGAGGVSAFLVLYALALAGLSLLGPAAMVSLLAFAGTLWLYAGRRRKAAEKHAGLRSLR